MNRSESKIKRHIWMVMFMIIVIQTSCRKFVDIPPPTDKITQENIFSNDQAATTALTGIYNLYNRGDGVNIAKFGGLLSDEFKLWSGGTSDDVAYYTNGFVANQTTNTGKEIWNTYYPYVFRCNSAIEGLNNSETLSPQVKRQLTGEAHFMRAWIYFYLANLYGDLPLAISTDPSINSILTRSPLQSVYQLIIADLLKAQELLNLNFVDGQLIPYTGIAERVRPTHWAATAMLARVYLYAGNYSKAELEADKVISNSSLFNLKPYSSTFLKNSQEAIWQMQSVEIGWNTREGRMFHLAAAPIGLSNNKPVSLSLYLLNSFEANDLRRKEWVDSLIVGSNTYYFPAKYKIGAQNSGITSPASISEYSMMLRLGEQYLIRAEARARQNNISEAISDLDVIRSRAMLPLIADINPSISQQNLLEAILHERQVELFTEWGHRWFDLSRTGNVDAVMSLITPLKGGTWDAKDKLLPIPYTEIFYNSNLTQNPNY